MVDPSVGVVAYGVAVVTSTRTFAKAGVWDARVGACRRRRGARYGSVPLDQPVCAPPSCDREGEAGEDGGGTMGPRILEGRQPDSAQLPVLPRAVRRLAYHVQPAHGS